MERKFTREGNVRPDSLEREFFRMATMFLACRGEQKGIRVPGMSGDKVLALVGEVDAWREMLLIVREWRERSEQANAVPNNGEHNNRAPRAPTPHTGD